MNARSILLGTAALAALSACAATDSLESTTPISAEQGTVAPQRNLLLSDLSAGSPGNGRAVNEEFDLPVASFRVAETTNGDQSPNGLGPLGLVRGAASNEFYGAGNKLTYLAGTNQFEFNISTDAGQFNRTLQYLLVQDPVDTPGVANSGVAKFMFSNPMLSFNGRYGPPIKFRDAYDLGLGANPSIAEITAELTRLQESTNEAENDLYKKVTEAANNYIRNSDQFAYGYQFAGGNGYVAVTNMNDKDRDRVTDSVAIVSMKEFYDNGEQFHAHTVFGHRTPLPEMPTRGTAEYRGKLVGNVLTNNSVRSLTGSANLNVNFTTGKLGISLATVIREGANNANATTFINYKTLTGDGVISDTTFGGNLTETNGTATGKFAGTFFGPAANEAGGTFAFGDNASYAAGAFTARQPDSD